MRLKTFNLLLITLLSLLTPFGVAAATDELLIGGGEHSYPLAGTSRYVRDESGEMTLINFLEMDKSNLPMTDPRGLVYGVTDKYYWFYTKVKNISEQKEWKLAFEYFGNGGAEIYLRPIGGEWRYVDGINRSIERHFFVPLLFEKNEVYEIVIKSISPGPDKFHIHLLDIEGKESFVVADNRWLGLFYGGIVTLILYNIFVALSMRSYSYAAYVLYLSSILAFLFTLDGFGQIYIWGEHEAWSRSSYYALVGIFVACGCNFSRLFLETKQSHPFIDKFLKGIIVLALLLTVCEILFSSHPFFTNFAMLLASLYASVIFTIGIIAYVKGNRVARYFLLGWLFPVGGVLYTTSMYGGFLPFDTLGYNMVHVTTLVQAILLSMALADRINFLREERESAINASKIRLEVSNRELEKANQLKNAFLGTISHELRTPMNGVIAGIPLLKPFLKGKGERDLLNTMERSSDSMLKMVDRILSFSEMQAGTAEIKQEATRLSEWIVTLSKRWQTYCEAKPLKWQLDLKIDEALGVLIDQQKVQQVLSELVSNAIKFTEKGSVVLKVDVFEINGIEYLRFDIKDTGIGIPKKRRLEVFKSFKQVQGGFDRRYGGLGIGLALSKEIATMLNAELKIQDVDDNGTDICFYLPLLRAELPTLVDPTGVIDDAGQTLEENAEDHNKALQVLVVEDNPVNQMIMKKILGALGHEFSVAEDGVKAVKASKAKHYDVILMDCQMPNMDGFEATKIIRNESSLNQSTPIVAVTANAMEADRKRCLDAGMDDYLKKPVKPTMIDDALHRWAS